MGTVRGHPMLWNFVFDKRKGKKMQGVAWCFTDFL